MEMEPTLTSWNVLMKPEGDIDAGFGKHIVLN